MTLSILLRCKSLKHTKAFYHSLGFEVEDINESTLALHRFGARLLFTELNPWNSPIQMSGTLYFSVPNVDQFYTELQGQVEFAWELQDMPYGTREFGLRDCNGYHLAFMQAE